MMSHWKLFCETLSLDEWEKAQGIWAQLDTEGSTQELLKANTKEIYLK